MNIFRFTANFIVDAIIILLVASMFINSIGLVLIVIFGGLILAAVSSAVVIQIKSWIIFDWLNW